MPTPRRPGNAKVQINTGPIVAADGPGQVTARVAGGLRDMRLPISPKEVPVKTALQNLAKAINIAFDSGFLENELETVYKVARVSKGTVEILHSDYIGLGDGVFATIGKVGRSIQLTLRGPDPAGPEGKRQQSARGRRPITGVLNLLGRKLDFLQEFEDQVPAYVEQLLDRLEAANMVTGWCRSEWVITTKLVGLDVVLRPRTETDPD